MLSITSRNKKNPDGTTSTSPGPWIGPVARRDAGTFVAVNDGRQQWYEKQSFYRSTDGVTWDALEPGAFVGSHPMTFISFGMAEPSAMCP
jgi:hypothetical protein